MKVPTVVGEEQIYKRFLSVYNRSVKYPATNGQQEQTFEFDVVGHPKSNFHFTCVFPVSFTAAEPEVTLIKEYCWGPNAVLYSLPTGGFDPSKHSSYSECARSELSEEARLAGGELIQLLPDGHPGISESKWCANRFTPFLVMNPESDSTPGQREAEEFIEVVTVPLRELTHDLLYSGYFSQPSFTTAQLALRHLRASGRLPAEGSVVA